MLELEVYRVLLNIPNLEVEKVEIEKNAFHIYCKIVNPEAQTCPSCMVGVLKKNTQVS